MPRLEEDLDDVKMKQRKKKRKMKSKGLLNENQQDFNDIIRDQIKKHDKTQNQKDSNKAKKSYQELILTSNQVISDTWKFLFIIIILIVFTE